jgi:hypothetical protein
LHDLCELPVVVDRLDRDIKSQEMHEDTPFFLGVIDRSPRDVTPLEI